MTKKTLGAAPPMMLLPLLLLHLIVSFNGLYLLPVSGNSQVYTGDEIYLGIKEKEGFITFVDANPQALQISLSNDVVTLLSFGNGLSSAQNRFSSDLASNPAFSKSTVAAERVLVGRARLHKVTQNMLILGVKESLEIKINNGQFKIVNNNEGEFKKSDKSIKGYEAWWKVTTGEVVALKKNNYVYLVEWANIGSYSTAAVNEDLFTNKFEQVQDDDYLYARISFFCGSQKKAIVDFADTIWVKNEEADSTCNENIKVKFYGSFATVTFGDSVARLLALSGGAYYIQKTEGNEKTSATSFCYQFDNDDRTESVQGYSNAVEQENRYESRETKTLNQVINELSVVTSAMDKCASSRTATENEDEDEWQEVTSSGTCPEPNLGSQLM